MYTVWVVFSKDKKEQYYVINNEFSSVQSVWQTAQEAKQVCLDLNRRLEKKVS